MRTVVIASLIAAIAASVVAAPSKTKPKPQPSFNYELITLWKETDHQMGQRWHSVIYVTNRTAYDFESRMLHVTFDDGSHLFMAPSNYEGIDSSGKLWNMVKAKSTSTIVFRTPYGLSESRRPLRYEVTLKCGPKTITSGMKKVPDSVL